MEELTIIGKKHRPLGTKDAALLTAWKHVCDAHGWSESLMCVDCFKNHADNAYCHGATYPGKSITIDCKCSERHWIGVTK